MPPFRLQKEYDEAINALNAAKDSWAQTPTAKRISLVISILEVAPGATDATYECSGLVVRFVR